MRMKLLKIAVKGLKETVRDRKGFVFLMLFPVLFILIFRLAFGFGATVNQTYDIGGSETLSLRQVAETIMQVIRQPRWLVVWPTPWMRALTVLAESVFPRFPANVFWLDYLAVNRTCRVDTITQVFGLMPARFVSRLDYLRGVHWGRHALGTLFIRHA